LIEEPFFFSREGAQLFAILHRAGETPRTGLVMCHPFGEEKLWSHRVFVSFARALAARGTPVLRFDFMGAGDSSGAMPDTSLDTHLADLEAAIAALRQRVPSIGRVGLAGLRLGASVAALYAEREAGKAAKNAKEGGGASPLDGAPLVLWDPVLDGESHFQELLRINLSTQLAVYGKVQETRDVLQARIRAGETVNVDGYEIGPSLFSSCARADLLSPGAKRHRGPALVVQIVPNDKLAAREDLMALARAYAPGEVLRATEQPFWREIKPFYGRAPNLQQITFDWLERSSVNG
jgi:uncharacterized protein